MALSQTHPDSREAREGLILQLSFETPGGSLLTRGGAQRLVDQCDAVLEPHPRKYKIYWRATNEGFIQSAARLVAEKRRAALDSKGRGESAACQLVSP